MDISLRIEGNHEHSEDFHYLKHNISVNNWLLSVWVDYPFKKKWINKNTELCWYLRYRFEKLAKHFSQQKRDCELLHKFCK